MELQAEAERRKRAQASCRQLIDAAIEVATTSLCCPVLTLHERAGCFTRRTSSMEINQHVGKQSTDSNA